MLDMEIVIRPLAVCSTPPPHRVLHFRVELGGYISHLVHQGAIQKGADDGYYTPIPSFRNFLVEQENLVPDLETTAP